MNKKIIFGIILLFSKICLAQQQQVDPVKGGKTLDYEDSTRITELFFSGLNAKAKLNVQQADNYFKQIIEIDPESDAALYELASIYHAQSQEKEAERLVRTAIRVKPNNEWYWLLLSDIYKKTNNFAQLNLAFDELIKIAPQKENYYFDKATALLDQNKANEALAIYDILEKRHGLSDDLINARQLIYQKQGKTDKTIESDKQVKNNSQGKPEESFEELKSSFEVSKDVDAKISIMLSYFSKIKDAKEMEQAGELAAILVQAYPTNARIHAIYGDILFRQKKPAEALKSYKEALGLDNQNYTTWENVIQIEAGTADFDAAIKDGEEALTVFPSQAAIYLHTAIAYAQKKNYEKAVSYLKNAASLETEDNGRQAQIYLALGDSYNALKNSNESTKAYQKALQMSRLSNEADPNNPSFEDTYAWILFRQKNYKEARTWIEKAIKNNKVENTAHAEHYGDILIQLGETELAVRQWIKAKNNGVKTEKLDRKINEKKYIE